jgi:hypothetical protein
MYLVHVGRGYDTRVHERIDPLRHQLRTLETDECRTRRRKGEDEDAPVHIGVQGGSVDLSGVQDWQCGGGGKVHRGREVGDAGDISLSASARIPGMMGLLGCTR